MIDREKVQQLWSELHEIALKYMNKEISIDINEYIEDYSLIQELCSDLESILLSEDFDEVSEAYDGLQETKLALLNMFKENLPTLVNGIYSYTQDKISEAKALDNKIVAVDNAMDYFEQLSEWYECDDNPLLVRAMKEIEKFQSKLYREQANKEAEVAEKEFKERIKGISFTATKKQIRYLLNLGAKPEDLDGIDKQQASAMISNYTRK